jgi:hypothetical protein
VQIKKFRVKNRFSFDEGFFFLLLCDVRLFFCVMFCAWSLMTGFLTIHECQYSELCNKLNGNFSTRYDREEKFTKFAKLLRKILQTSNYIFWIIHEIFSPFFGWGTFFSFLSFSFMFAVCMKRWMG